MSRFKIFRAIIAILVIAMFVGVPIVTAETAVIRGAGRGTETTFSGTSSSEGSVSMMAGHSASAQVGFHQVQTGKGTTSQTIHGGSELATDPFATVQIGNADVSVSATVTGKGNTAATGVAEASGYLNASADEDDSTNPTGVNVTTSIASFANATTGPRGTSAVAVASTSGFVFGEVSANSSLSAESSTEGSTSAYAAANGANSHSLAQSIIRGEGNAGTGTSPATGNSATAVIHLNGLVEGRGTATSSAEGDSTVTTLFNETSGDFIATFASVSGLEESTISARNGLVISDVVVIGSGMSGLTGNGSESVIGSSMLTSGHASGTLSVTGESTAGTSVNLTGDTADIAVTALGTVGSSVAGQTGVTMTENSLDTTSESFTGGIATGVSNRAFGRIDGTGSILSTIEGIVSSEAVANTSGRLIESSSEASGSTDVSSEVSNGQADFTAEIAADSFMGPSHRPVAENIASAGMFGDSAVFIGSETRIGGTGSIEASANSDMVGSSTYGNISGIFTGTNTEAFGFAGSVAESLRISIGLAAARAMIHSGSEVGSDGDARLFALNQADSYVSTSDKNSAGSATGMSDGEANAGGSLDNLNSAEFMTGSAGTGDSSTFAGIELVGRGYGSSRSSIEAVQETRGIPRNNAFFFIPLLIPDGTSTFGFGTDTVGDTIVETDTMMYGNSANFEGYADASATAGMAGTAFENSSPEGFGSGIVTTLYDPFATSGSAVVGKGFARDTSLIVAETAVGIDGGLFEGDLASFTSIQHRSISETYAKRSKAMASGAAAGEAVAMGNSENEEGNASTFNNAFGSAETESSAANKDSESSSLSTFGGLQVVDLFIGSPVDNGSPETLLDDGMFTATWSASYADASGKSANAFSTTGGFDQGALVSGSLFESGDMPTRSDPSIDITSYSQTLGGTQAEARAHKNAESLAVAGAGSVDISGVDNSGHLITEGGSGMATISLAETFGRKATGSASASVKDVATGTDGILIAEEPILESIGGASVAEGPVVLTHHSGLSGDAASTVSARGGNETVPHVALGLAAAVGLQSAEVDPYDDFNGTSTSLGAFGAASLMNGRLNANAEISDVNIASLASTSGGFAEPTAAQIFFTNGGALANLVGNPLSGETDAQIQTESLIAIGPTPFASELIADGHFTSPEFSSAYGYAIGEATSDQNS